MDTKKKIPLAQRLSDPRVKRIDPHEVAREVTSLFYGGNSEGIKKLREAYIIGQFRRSPYQSAEQILAVVDDNLQFSAGLADIVQSSHYEASGQLLVQPKLDGPIATFYKQSVGTYSR